MSKRIVELKVITDVKSRNLDRCKIARISTVPFFVFSQLNNQIQDLANANGDIYIVCSPGKELKYLGSHRNIRTYAIKISRKISPIQDISAVFRIYNFLKSEQIQICHSTTPKAGILSMLAAYLAGTPVRLHTFTGQPWATGNGFKNTIVKLCDKLLSQLATKTYADSASQREFLIENNIVPNDKIDVIGTGSLAGVELKRFEQALNKFTSVEVRRDLGISNSAFVLIFVGRITPEKGINELVKAFERMRQKYSDVELIIVGPIDQESGSGQSYNDKSKLQASGIHFTGFTSEPEKFLRASNLLCLPSYREGFGTVVLEAAALGIPSVASDIYGLRDAVVDNQTGLLVEKRCHEELYQAIEKLYLDRDLLKIYGKNAKKRCHSLFDSYDVSKQLIDEYLKLRSSESSLD